LSAYDHVLDFATGKAPIGEAWIRELHSVICANQDTYWVQTDAGPQEQELPKGQYKTHPNHVRTVDGKLHSYAPVIDTPVEMQRFVRELNTEVFDQAHPVIQAAFAHYALVAIHPFPDGNGRVARALASVFTFRAQSMPLLILFEHKREYVAALHQADASVYQPLTDFMLDRTIGAAILLHSSFKTADVGDVNKLAQRITSMYVTQGGYTHAALDDACARLLSLMSEALQRTLNIGVAGLPRASLNVGVERKLASPEMPWNRGTHRMAVDGFNYLSARVLVPPPANAEWSAGFWIYLPIAGRRQDLVIITNGAEIELELPLGDLIPAVTNVTAWTIQMFAERIAGRAFDYLAQTGHNRLKQLGYL
jgi:Fic/DOC family